MSPVLHTPRLSIYPLTLEHLHLYMDPGQAFEAAWNLHPGPRPMSANLLRGLEKNILPALNDPANNYLFCTLWTIVLKTEKTVAGDLCLKGMPNEKGEVEIGYGTYPAFQHKGYMSEAVGALCEWTLQQPGVRAVVADTDPQNTASQRILEKNGFLCLSRTPDNLSWRLASPV